MHRDDGGTRPGRRTWKIDPKGVSGGNCRKTTHTTQSPNSRDYVPKVYLTSDKSPRYSSRLDALQCKHSARVVLRHYSSNEYKYLSFTHILALTAPLHLLIQTYRNPKGPYPRSSRDLSRVQRFTSTNWHHPWDPYSIYQSIRMTDALQRGHPRDDIGATPSGIVEGIAGTSIGGGDIGATPDVTLPSVTREQIKGHLSALRSLVKEHNNRGKVSPIRLNFDDLEDRTVARAVVTGKEVGDADLRKPFKEAVKTPLSHRIIEFVGPEFKMPANIKLYDGTTDSEDHLSRFSSVANSWEWLMPVWYRMFQQTLDGSARGWFENLPIGSIDGWTELRQQFATRFSTRRSSFKYPTEITRIVRKANETLVAFKERWTVETGFIVGVPEVLKTVDEMMVRLDDFVRSEEAFSSMKLPKGEGWSSSIPPANPQRGPSRVSSLEAKPKLTHQATQGNTSFEVTVKLTASTTDAAPAQERKLGQRGRGNGKGRDNEKDKMINMIRSWSDDRKRKAIKCDKTWIKAPIVFHPVSMEDSSDEPLIIEVVTEGYLVRRVCVDQEVLVEFPTPRGIATLVTRTMIISECRRIEKMIDNNTRRETRSEEYGKERVDLAEQVLVNPSYPDQLVTIGVNLSEWCKSQLKALLKRNLDIFAWEPDDMIEVEEWLKTGIIHPVRYPIWISNPVLVNKGDGSWRMYIDFKNLNLACPKDYYPLPDIDGKIESVAGFQYKCFLDGYKGYHQVWIMQISQENGQNRTNTDTRMDRVYKSRENAFTSYTSHEPPIGQSPQRVTRGFRKKHTKDKDFALKLVQKKYNEPDTRNATLAIRVLTNLI
ncbi:hypothetical protein Tco_0855557 [Tanacetum coccineum]